MKRNIHLLLCGLFLVYAGFAQTVQKYGPVIHYAHTWNRFDEILNSYTPTGMDPNSTSVIIKGENGNKFATFILDIGDHNGQNMGVNPFRFIVFNLDSNGNTSYRAIEVKDPQGNVITTTLGRTDGHSVFGPGGKIYIPTYGLGKYLIEFDPNTYKAVAYPSPPGLFDFFIVGVGPAPDATNPKTLVYGGTFNASQVWWFDPSDPNPKIKFVEFEIDGRQNYIHQVIGRGDWIYAKMINRGLAGGAYRSLYAVNVKTEKKYLLFHSTKSNFDVKGFVDREKPGENNVFLAITGKSPGTIYPNPVGIPMSDPAPPGVAANCPCYNIDPAGTYWPFPSAIRTKYFKSPYYGTTELTNFAPQYTTFQYNQNYAWDTKTHQPFVAPPMIQGYYICNPNIDNGDLFNVPWDLVSKFPKIPTSSYNYYFRIDGEKIDVSKPIEDGNHLWKLWNSNDPYFSDAGKPLTAWDLNSRTLYYQFPGKAVQNKQVGFYSVTNNPNDLHDYDANLSGLSMTATSGVGWPNGAATLVKGDKKEGFGVVRGVPQNTSHPLGYEHELFGKNINETEDIYALGEPFRGSRFATHVISGYPGDVQFFNYSKPMQYSSACAISTPGLSACNPRLVSKMYPLEILLADGNSQYGPQTSVGARMYSYEYDQPTAANEINYKVIAVGIAGRARQGLFSSIGIHKFKVNDSTGEYIPVTNPYKVIDRINYPYFDDYTPVSLCNETVSVECMMQPERIKGFINSPYNEAKGYYTPVNTASCKNSFLKMLISVRPINPAIKKNQLWLFNTTTDKIVSALDLPDPELNYLPIEYLKSVSDFYMGKTTGCNSAGQCVNTIFLFKIKNGVVNPNSIVKFKDPSISYITNYAVMENVDDFRGNGKIYKVFFSYRDNVNAPQLASFDIIATQNRQKLKFGTMKKYTLPDAVDIRDFAYVPKQNATITDLMMVGGKNVYVLKDVVPQHDYYSTPARPAKPVETPEESDQPFVYPNPFTSTFDVNTSTLVPGTYSIRLLDNTGKLVLMKQITVDRKQATQRINVPVTASKGLYLLQVSGAESNISFKLIKQ